MNDLPVYLVVAFVAIESSVVTYLLSRRKSLSDAEVLFKEKIDEQLKDRLGRDWKEEKEAKDLNEELRKNKHDRNKDGFVMLMIAVLIGAGLYFLWQDSTGNNHSDSKGWAVGALDTLLGVVVGYGFSKHNSNK